MLLEAIYHQVEIKLSYLRYQFADRRHVLLPCTVLFHCWGTI